MKIDFKKPRYILPLIILPFIFLFFYIFQSWGASAKYEAKQAMTDSLAKHNVAQVNPDLPGVSKDVANEEIKDKFQSLQDAYKNDRDYSALATLGDKERQLSDYTSAYSKDDIQALQSSKQLDSLRKSLNQNRQNLDRNMQMMINSANNRSPSYSSAPYKADHSYKEIYNKIRQSSDVYGSSDPDNSSRMDQMDVFRQQMRLVDSLQKANRETVPELVEGSSNKGKLEKVREIDPLKDSTFSPLHVSIAPKNSNGFNTVRIFRPDESIKAIIDHDEKVYAGTRIRIRLLQDIVVGNNAISKGTYLYGFITGFQTQRVNISITQVMFEGTPLPVRLDVFDSDGYLGLYVPGSNFREFSKEIGTQGTNGLSSIQSASDGQDITRSLISKLFTTTTSSIDKAIKKDKAIFKYNYIIYLKERE